MGLEVAWAVFWVQDTLPARTWLLAGAVASFVLDHCFGIGQGFDSYQSPPRLPGESPLYMVERRGDEMVDLARFGRWLDDRAVDELRGINSGRQKMVRMLRA